ncbi:MAG: HNH endonuclease [Sphaerospermopsis sp. SIO1G2]|nr:HNH endonuclease [Sphaerospermopsis sp. SIO1G2]
MYGGSIIKTRHPQGGYEYFTASDSQGGKKKTLKIHRLVATYFLKKKRPDQVQVNHLDSNTANNHYSNLEWCTSAENNRHAIEHGRRTNPFGAEAHGCKGGIECYDPEGNYLFTTYGAKEIIDAGFTLNGVYACACGTQKTHRNHTFKWENKNE